MIEKSDSLAGATSRRSILKAGVATGAAIGLGESLTTMAQAQPTTLSGLRGIVDAQCYTSAVWYLPIESLIGEMDRAGVDRGVLVQFDGEVDNEYQFGAVHRFPGRFANVVALSYDKPDAPQTLKGLANRGACGLRIPASVRSPGTDPLAIWKAAAELSLSISCSGQPSDFLSDDFAKLVQSIPQVPIVLEHAGGAYGSNAPIDDLKKVYALARFPNVHAKIGGLSEFARRAIPVTEPFPFVKPIPPVLDMVYDAFGAQRMMWGSDYPPVASREGYRNALGFTMEQLMSKSAEDRAWIFGRTAAKVFRTLA